MQWNSPQSKAKRGRDLLQRLGKISNVADNAGLIACFGADATVLLERWRGHDLVPVAAALSTKAGASRRSAILQPRPPPTQPPGDADADEEPQPLLFVAVNTHGLHGATGWGTMSPALLPILETVAAMMEANLWKWHQANEQRLEKQAAQERQLLAERQVRDGEAVSDEDIDESEADLVGKSLKKRLSIADEDSSSSISSTSSASSNASRTDGGCRPATHATRYNSH